jgi:neural Wiskott-Aldrich syndrome protein
MMGGNDASPVAASIPPSLAPPPFPASTAPPPPPEPPEPAVPALPAEPPAPPALVVPPPDVALLVVVLPPVPPPDVVVLDPVEPPVLVALVVAEPPVPLVWDPVDPGRSEPASEQASVKAHTSPKQGVATTNLRDLGGNRSEIGAFLIA